MTKAAVAVLMVVLVSALADDTQKLLQQLEFRLQALEKSASTYRAVIESLARQVSMQQFYVEETTRSTGDSGIKRARITHAGSRPYHATSFTDIDGVAAIHDHSNYERTIGMGEIIAVLNGVEFKTRHNDYKLVMPSTKSKVYGATEPIPLPRVPPQVLAKPTVEEQGLEMREWFRAWKVGDHRKRDYRKYFKPVLCYLEGMWTESDGETTINEPFSSDRHKLDAESFFDLQKKAVYSSATGSKSISENFAFLPTTISRISTSGLPIYSQWNYQILCHPLKQDIPRYRWRPEDDLGPRVTKIKSYDESLTERYQRFSILPNQPFKKDYQSTRETVTSKLTGSVLDELMAEIPGKDNYPGNLRDNVFDNLVLDYQQRYSSKRSPQNVAYYHRLYKMSQRGAMGSDIAFRSFSDANLYVAFNSRPQITPVQVDKCRAGAKKCTIANAQKGVCEPCKTWTNRVSYAIPLEIIYLTPLLTWNPYDLNTQPDINVPRRNITDGKYSRTGTTPDSALNGTSTNYYHYLTPLSFYGSEGTKMNAADTVYPSLHVLDKTGNIRETMASGTYIFTPNIEGVGKFRLRYPIMPLHQSGNAIYKELEALKDITMRGTKYSKFYRDRITADNGTWDEIFTFEVVQGNGPYGPHYHTVDVTASELRAMKAGKYITTRTSTDIGHSHDVRLRIKNPKSDSNSYVELVECDGKGWQCPDGHKGKLICNECHNDRAFPDIN